MGAGDGPRRVRVAFVGSPGAGKSSVQMRYSSRGFRDSLRLLAADAFAEPREVLGEQVMLEFWDTCEVEPRLRQFNYALASVVALCFSLADPATLDAAAAVYAAQAAQYCPGVPLVLVGTQADRLATRGDARVTPARMREVARSIAAAKTVTCSSATGEGVDEAIAVLTQVGLEHERGLAPPQAQRFAQRLAQRFGCLVS